MKSIKATFHTIMSNLQENASTEQITAENSHIKDGLTKHSLIALAAIAAINFLVWIAHIFSGASLFEPSVSSLLGWGGSLSIYSLTIEPWRLFTSMFVHSGLVHLIMNMALLAQVALPILARFGALGFVCIYFLGGLFATTGSAVWNAFYVIDALNPSGMFWTRQVDLMVSVGASGAIMAVCGAFLAVLLRSSMEPDLKAQDQQLKGILLVIGINLVTGFVMSGVDQVQHIVGLIAGFVLGSVLPLVDLGPHPNRAPLRWILTLTLGLTLLWALFNMPNNGSLINALNLLQKSPIN